MQKSLIHWLVRVQSVNRTFVSKSMEVQRWRGGSEQGGTSSSCHANAVNTEQQHSSVHSLSEERNLTQEGRQAQSCNFLCYQIDADWQSSYWIFCSQWGIFRGASRCLEAKQHKLCEICKQLAGGVSRVMLVSAPVTSNRGQKLSFRLPEKINTRPSSLSRNMLTSFQSVL